MNTTLFYNRDTGAAAIGKLTPNSFTTIKEFQQASFNTWTHIVARDSTLLFYNRDTGAAAIGTLTSNNFTTTKAFGPGSFSAWTHIVNIAPG